MPIAAVAFKHREAPKHGNRQAGEVSSSDEMLRNRAGEREPNEEEAEKA